MKKIILDRIVTLEDLAARDKQENGLAWLLWKCEEGIRKGKFSARWDGKRVEGEAVMAFVNNGRWGARCKVCNAPQYVSPKTPVFFCAECGCGNSGRGWGVEFPENRERIEAALLAREVTVDESLLIRNVVELAMHARPKTPGLARNWRAGIEAETLEEENAERKGKR
ncbi:MAG: hypothetical protein HUU11_18995 [Anaerolineales bacterium]|nr:hypothetical protein [Anaerolineales bacterium]